MESDDFKTVHFTLTPDEGERVRKALQGENRKRQTPIAKNPFVKNVLMSDIQRRGF